VLTKGDVAELLPRDNDPEFNERYGPALQERAAKDYGRMVSELADLGIKELPPELGKAIANFALYGIAGMVATKRAQALENELMTLTKNVEKTNRYSRPNIGATGGGGVSSPAPAKPNSTRDAADAILRKIGVNI